MSHTLVIVQAILLSKVAQLFHLTGSFTTAGYRFKGMYGQSILGAADTQSENPLGKFLSNEVQTLFRSSKQKNPFTKTL